MNKFKPFVAMGVLVVCYLLGMVMVTNSHLLYGGHEAMLFKALEPIVIGEPLELKGEITLVPKGDETISSLMRMDFGLEGTMNSQSEHGEISITYSQPYGSEPLTIAKLIQEEGELCLIPMDDARSPIDLSGLLLELEEDGLENSWADIYAVLDIDEGHVQDPRFDNGYLKRRVTNYHLDLLDLLNEAQLNEMAILLGAGDIQGMALTLDLQVDKEGALVGIHLNSEAATFIVTGWLTLLP